MGGYMMKGERQRMRRKTGRRESAKRGRKEGARERGEKRRSRTRREERWQLELKTREGKGLAGRTNTWGVRVEDQNKVKTKESRKRVCQRSRLLRLRPRARLCDGAGLGLGAVRGRGVPLLLEALEGLLGLDGAIPLGLGATLLLRKLHAQVSQLALLRRAEPSC